VVGRSARENVDRHARVDSIALLKLERDTRRSVGNRTRIPLSQRSRIGWRDHGRRPGDRLGHHGNDLRAQIQIELDGQVHAAIEGVAVGVLQRRRAGADEVDVVEVVGKRLRETDDHFVGLIADANPAVVDGDFVAVVKRAVGAAPLDLNAAQRCGVAQRSGVDHLAFIEMEDHLLRRDVEHVGVFDHVTHVGGDGHQFRTDGQQHALLELLELELAGLGHGGAAASFRLG